MMILDSDLIQLFFLGNPPYVQLASMFVLVRATFFEFLLKLGRYVYSFHTLPEPIENRLRLRDFVRWAPKRNKHFPTIFSTASCSARARVFRLYIHKLHK